MTDTPNAIVCNLTKPDLRDRKVILRNKLAPYLTETTYGSGASQLVFSKSNLTRQSLERLIELERDCCPFFSFALSETENDFHLSVKGPEGSEEMVRNFFSAPTGASCGCSEPSQSSGTKTTRNVVGFITLCAIACAIPPTLAALGLIGAATGVYLGKGIEVSLVALALMGLGYFLIHLMKKKRGTLS